MGLAPEYIDVVPEDDVHIGGNAIVDEIAGSPPAHQEVQDAQDNRPSEHGHVHEVGQFGGEVGRRVLELRYIGDSR